MPEHDPRYTARFLVEVVDDRAEARDVDPDTATDLTRAEADAVIRDRVRAWRDLGYSVRFGDGWAAGASASVTAWVVVEPAAPLAPLAPSPPSGVLPG